MLKKLFNRKKGLTQKEIDEINVQLQNVEIRIDKQQERINEFGERVNQQLIEAQNDLRETLLNSSPKVVAHILKKERKRLAKMDPEKREIAQNDWNSKYPYKL